MGAPLRTNRNEKVIKYYIKPLPVNRIMMAFSP